MNAILLLLKGLLGTKFGWIIAIVVGVILGGSLVKNIVSGSFSIAKFASGFNPFSGGVQGKLIYYGLIFFACILVYNFVMRPTNSYDTDYRNQITGNQDVIIDQSVGAKCIPTKILWGLIQFGCTSAPINKTVTVNNECVDCKVKEVRK